MRNAANKMLNFSAVMMALYLALSGNGYSQPKIRILSATELFANSSGVALVSVANVVRVTENVPSVCDSTSDSYAIRIKAIELFRGEPVPAVVCSAQSYCLDCKILAVIGTKEHPNYLRHAWPVEHLPSGQGIRPLAGDPLLPSMRLRKQEVQLCSQEICRDVVMYNYISLEDIRKVLKPSRK